MSKAVGFVIKRKDGSVLDVGSEDGTHLTFDMCSDGVYERRKTSFGEACIRSSNAGFLRQGTEYLKWQIPKIPVDFYYYIFNFFAAHDSEVYAQVFWDPNLKKYFIHIPKQTVTGASVKFERDSKLEENNGLILEIHSHNSMGAFFSSTDDADEQRPGIYGVIGNIRSVAGSESNEKPQLKLRYKSGNGHIPLDFADVFDVPIEYPAEWDGNVVESRFEIPSYPNYTILDGRSSVEQGSAQLSRSEKKQFKKYFRGTHKNDRGYDESW